MFFSHFNSERRDCTIAILSQDPFYEHRESFYFDLHLDAETSGVEIRHPRTEIFILDNSGKIFVLRCSYGSMVED